MIVLQTVAVAFAMFSAVPVPQFNWTEKNMRYAMCAFPLIGVVIGLLWFLCGVLPLPGAARAAGFCLIPVWVTGGIHLDGYADTCDALSSYGDREKKLEILKDPHCGAFAVIRLCSYFAAYLALCACVQFTPQAGLLWMMALVLERTLSGYAVAAFPMAKNTGLAHTFASAADRATVRRVLALLAAVLCCAMLALGGWALVLAAKGLAQESMNVHKELVKGDLPAARKAVSRIVGRDTQNLTAEGVTKAAVETVAENASDGVIAPLLYMLIGGAPLALTYKAINTMDSMLGYKNEKYLYFGRIPAKLDDAANYLPSRLAGLLWCAAAALTGNSAKGAWRIWRRDRRNHASPNSAQTESACAGALGVQLAGPAYYFGEYYPKPTIGDALRPIEPEDIRRANKMMYAESLLALLLGLAIRGVIL